MKLYKIKYTHSKLTYVYASNRASAIYKISGLTEESTKRMDKNFEIKLLKTV